MILFSWKNNQTCSGFSDEKIGHPEFRTTLVSGFRKTSNGFQGFKNKRSCSEARHGDPQIIYSGPECPPLTAPSLAQTKAFVEQKHKEFELFTRTNQFCRLMKRKPVSEAEVLNLARMSEFSKKLKPGAKSGFYWRAKEKKEKTQWVPQRTFFKPKPSINKDTFGTNEQADGKFSLDRKAQQSKTASCLPPMAYSYKNSLEKLCPLDESFHERQNLIFAQKKNIHDYKIKKNKSLSKFYTAPKVF